MSALLYERIRGRADALLASYGRLVTLDQSQGEAIDPVTGVVTPGVTVTELVYAVFTELPESRKMDTPVNVSRRAFYVQAADTLTPRVGDRLHIAGETWRITVVEPISPADVVITYRLEAEQ